MFLLTFAHRWLGVAFCLLFTMWFASGMVMHFVPFPQLSEDERFAGLAPIELERVVYGPADAILASGLHGVVRVRLQAGVAGPVYVVQHQSGLYSFSATELTGFSAATLGQSLRIATGHAFRRGLDASRASLLDLSNHDQWTVSNGLDAHRPLYRVALNDKLRTELYISSKTGEVVRDTGRRERAWNYVGSVPHWIYPTFLRTDWEAWDRLVWWVSLIALVVVLSGGALGLLRLRFVNSFASSPYRGWRAWHHWFGIASFLLVLTWTFSGWLSMDHGRVFSTGKPVANEIAIVAGAASWADVTVEEVRTVNPGAREIEWFAFNGRILRRERAEAGVQRLNAAGPVVQEPKVFLAAQDIDALAGNFASPCVAATIVPSTDAYPVPSPMAGAPVYRLRCGSTWLHFDGASGALLEKLDASRRIYRWVYAALHTWNFPALVDRPSLRRFAILLTCVAGLVFSMTGVVLAWRRLRNWR